MGLLYFTFLSIPWTTQHQTEGLVNNTMKTMHNDAVMGYYDILPQLLTEQTEKNPEKCHSEQMVSRQDMYLGTPQILSTSATTSPHLVQYITQKK
jgi:hypothetical protein